MLIDHGWLALVLRYSNVSTSTAQQQQQRQRQQQQVIVETNLVSPWLETKATYKVTMIPYHHHGTVCF